MITTAMHKCADFSVQFVQTAVTSRNNIYTTQAEEGGFTDNVWIRMLFVAQMVVSIVSVPLSLLAMLVAPAFAICTEGPTEAWKLLKELGEYSLGHFTMIPASLIATFTPHSWECLSPFKETMECLK